MTNLSHPSHPRPMPLRALVFSVGAMLIPLTGGVLFPEWTEDEAGVLLWLTALVPAFLLTYYRGWRGASLGLALGMAVLSTGQVILVLTNLATPNWPVLFGIVLAFIGICFGMGWVAEMLHRERRKAENMALTDALTALPNRRHATIFLDAAFAAAARGTPMTVVLFDLDRFKAFNDRHGHHAGDEVLRGFGEILRAISRRMNLVARYGGEEFIGVLSACDTSGALVFTERVLGRLRAARFRGEKVTACAGIASFEKGMGSPDLLVAAADRALYAAKSGGRDCVRAIRRGEVFDPAPPPGMDAGSPASAGGGPGSGAAPPASVEPRGRTVEEPAAPMAGARPGERILVIDDDDGSRTSVVRLLRRLGYDVAEESDGESGIARLAREELRCDLVLADLVMPGMSGFTMVERMCRSRPELRVLYISGFLHHDVTWSGAPGHVTDFLGKPMTIEELARKVRGVLDAEGAAEAPGERVPVAS